MTIPALSPIPKRTQQPDPFTSAQHDYIHTLLHNGLSATIDVVNQLVAGVIGALPAGTMAPYGGTTEPAGYLFCNGQAVSQATYPTLYAVIGTTFGAGGAGTFRVPDLRARMPIGTNPMGGLTNGSYSTRTLTTVYGAESYTNASVAVSGNTPVMTVNFSSMGSVTFQTFNAGAFPTLTGGTLPSLNAGTLPSLNAGTLPSLVGGVLPSSSGGAMPTLSASGGGATINANIISGLEINGVTCVDVGVSEPGQSAIDCSATLTVEDFTPTIDKTAILGALSLSAGSFPTFDAGSFPTLNAGSFPTLNAGAFPTLNAGAFQTLTAGTLPSVSGGNNNVTGAAATTPATALSGVTASISVPTIPPSLALNWVIKT